MCLKTIRRKIYHAYCYVSRLIDSIIELLIKQFMYLCLKLNSFMNEQIRHAFRSLSFQTHTISSTIKGTSKGTSVFTRESFRCAYPPHPSGIRKSLLIHSHPVYEIKRLPKFVTKFSSERVLFKKAREKFFVH